MWWYRRFNDVPKAFALLADNTVLFGTAGASPKIVSYPNRPNSGVATLTNYLDDASGVAWAIETQWMKFDGTDIEKTLRTIVAVIMARTTGGQSVIDFKINIYVDRQGAVDGNGDPIDPLNSDGTPFDVAYGTTINGKLELVLPVKVPNSFREVKFILKYQDVAELATHGQFDLSEIKLFGETSVTGEEF
jgi:hypothetical protein